MVLEERKRPADGRWVLNISPSGLLLGRRAGPEGRRRTLFAVRPALPGAPQSEDSNLSIPARPNAVASSGVGGLCGEVRCASGWRFPVAHDPSRDMTLCAQCCAPRTPPPRIL